MFVLSILACVIFTIFLLYRDLLSVYWALLNDPTYNYMLVVIPVNVYVFLKVIKNRFEVKNMDISRSIIFSSFLSLSLFFYILGEFLAQSYVEFKALSLVLFSWSIIIMFFKPEKPSIALLSILILLLMVPFPRIFLEKITYSSAKLLTNLISAVFSGILIESTDTLILLKKRDDSEAWVELTYSDLGSNYLVLFLLMIPLGIHVFSSLKVSIYNRILRIINFIATGIFIVFIGIFARLLLFLVVNIYLDGHISLKIFQFFPPILIYILALLLSLIITKRKREARPSTKNHQSLLVSTPLVCVLLTTLVIIVAFFNIVTLFAMNSTIQQTSIPVSKVPFFNNISSNSNVGYGIVNLSNTYSSVCIETETSLATYSLIVNDTRFIVCLQKDSSLSKFRKWPLYLITHGYVIEKSWWETGNSIAHYLLLRRDGEKLLLGYANYKYAGKGEQFYIRISLFSKVEKDYSIQLNLMRQIFSDVDVKEREYSYSFSILGALLIIVNLNTIIGIAVLSLFVINKMFIKRHFRKI